MFASDLDYIFYAFSVKKRQKLNSEINVDLRKVCSGRMTAEMSSKNILEIIENLLAKKILQTGADSGLVLLCKWRSRISFLWNVKQAKKRLRSGLIQSKSFCIFPCGLWCANFPVISTVKLLFRSMSFEVDCRSVKVFRVEFLTLKHPI